MGITLLKSSTLDLHEFFEEIKHKWKVKTLMSTNVLALKLSDHFNLIDASLDWRKYRHLPVIDDQRHIKGLVSHRDLMNDFASSLINTSARAKYSALENVAVRDVMIWNVVTIQPEASLEEAAKKLFENKLGCLPVVDADQKLIGILTEADFVRLIHFGERASK
jgi:CBS domain-containing membrane protein